MSSGKSIGERTFRQNDFNALTFTYYAFRFACTEYRQSHIILKFDMMTENMNNKTFSLPSSKWCGIIKCNFKLQEIETNSTIL